MHPELFREVTVRDTDRVVPYTLCLQTPADYFVPHRHNYIEFSYVIGGEGIEETDGQVHPLVPGTFSLLLPAQIHTLHARPEHPISFYVGGVSLDVLAALEPVAGNLESRLLEAPPELPSHVRFRDADAARVGQLFHEMLERVSGEDAWDRIRFLGRLLEVFALFDGQRRIGWPQAVTRKPLSSGVAEGTAPVCGSPAVPQSSDFRHIVRYVRLHANEPISLRMLSERFHRSESSISAGFRRLTGGSYLDFLHDLRIREACALLRATSLSVTQVAVEVGFESYETFARVFRQRKGMSARAFRRRPPGESPVSGSVCPPGPAQTLPDCP